MNKTTLTTENSDLQKPSGHVEQQGIVQRKFGQSVDGSEQVPLSLPPSKLAWTHHYPCSTNTTLVNALPGFCYTRVVYGTSHAEHTTIDSGMHTQLIL